MIVVDCTNCRWSRPSISDNPDEGPILKCHRFPPTLLVIADEVVQAHPDASEWCGEWQPT